MAKSLVPGWLTQLFDNLGAELNGGTINTYEAGTTTPLATYTDQAGLTARANPIVLDSAGRATGGIWLNPGVAYKFVVKTSGGSTLDTIDNIVSGEAAGATDEEIDIACSFMGTPTAQQEMFRHIAVRGFVIPVDMAGSRGSVGTNPGSTYTMSAKKDGVEIGTIAIDTAGTFTFTTTGGATQTFSAGNVLTIVGPASVGTAANFGITILADIS